MALDWNNLPSDKVEEILATDFSKGLTPKAVKERYKHSKNNLSLQKKELRRTESSLDYFSFSMLLLISAMSYFILPVWKAILFSFLCVSAVLIFIIVDEYTKKKISSHLDFYISHITVLRGGKQISIPSHFVVAGDVLKLNSGDTVPCNCYIIEESGLVISKKLSEDKKIIFADDIVASGSCTCVALASAASFGKNEGLNLRYNFISSAHLYRFVLRFSSFALLVLSLFTFIVLFADVFLKKETETVFYNFSSFLVFACSLLISCAPLLLKVCLSRFSVSELETNGAHIKSASALDRLSEIDCAVLDTGMLFDMENPVLAAVYVNNNIFPGDNLNTSELRNSALFDVLLSTEINAASHSTASGKYLAGLQKCFGMENGNDLKLISHRFKDPDFPFDTFLFENASGGTYASVKGELDSLIKSCSSVALGNKVISFDDGLKNGVLSAAFELNSLGCEIVAYAKNSSPDISLDNTHLSHKRLVFLGFVAYAKGQAVSSDEFFSACEKLEIEPVFIHYGTENELKLYANTSTCFSKRTFVDCKKIGDSVVDMKNALSRYDGFLNPNEKQYSSLLDTLSQNGIKFAHIYGQNSKNAQKEDGIFTLCFDNPDGEIRKESDTDCVDCDKALQSFESAITTSAKYKTRILKVLQFVAFLCFSKIFLMPIAIFTENAVFTPLKSALLIFVFDLLSLVVFLDNKRIKDLPLERKTPVFAFKAIFVFSLLTLITLLVSKLISLFNYGSELDILASVSFLIQLILPILYLTLKEKLQISEKLVIYLFAILMLITLCIMFTPVGELFGVISDVKILIASIVVSVVFFFIYCRCCKNINI